MELNKTYLLNLDTWFTAPDGEQYQTVFGTVTAILSSEKTLGIKTNAKSTNWYICIGNMTVAGCQVHTAFQVDKVNFKDSTKNWSLHEGKCCVTSCPSRIWNADGE